MAKSTNTASQRRAASAKKKEPSTRVVLDGTKIRKYWKPGHRVATMELPSQPTWKMPVYNLYSPFTGHRVCSIRKKTAERGYTTLEDDPIGSFDVDNQSFAVTTHKKIYGGNPDEAHAIHMSLKEKKDKETSVQTNDVASAARMMIGWKRIKNPYLKASSSSTKSSNPPVKTNSDDEVEIVSAPTKLVEEFDLTGLKDDQMSPTKFATAPSKVTPPSVKPAHNKAFVKIKKEKTTNKRPTTRCNFNEQEQKDYDKGFPYEPKAAKWVRPLSGFENEQMSQNCNFCPECWRDGCCWDAFQKEYLLLVDSGDLIRNYDGPVPSPTHDPFMRYVSYEWFRNKRDSEQKGYVWDKASAPGCVVDQIRKIFPMQLGKYKKSKML